MILPDENICRNCSQYRVTIEERESSARAGLFGTIKVTRCGSDNETTFAHRVARQCPLGLFPSPDPAPSPEPVQLAVTPLKTPPVRTVGKRCSGCSRSRSV